jgi:hypothetical protein
MPGVGRKPLPVKRSNAHEAFGNAGLHRTQQRAARRPAIPLSSDPRPSPSVHCRRDRAPMSPAATAATRDAHARPGRACRQDLTVQLEKLAGHPGADCRV